MGMPGGNILAGWGGNLQVATLGLPSDTLHTIDVAEWKLNINMRNKKVQHSGTYGSQSRRRTGVDWTADLKIWWDAKNIPELQLININSFQMNLLISNMPNWLQYGINEQAHWYSPSALLGPFEIVDNSEGEEVVIANIRVEANSPIFLLPYQQASLVVYQNWIALRGENI